MKFMVESDVLAIFPNITFGIVLGRIVARRSDFDAKLAEYRNQAMSRLAMLTDRYPIITDHPNLAAWRDAYRVFGVNPKRHLPTHEAFARRLQKDGQWPSINDLVDIYLTNQVAHLLPHGGYDLASVRGPLRLSLSKEREPFETFNGNFEETDVGEIVYRDSERVLTRRWNFRDCNATRITSQTQSFILMMESPSATISPDAVRLATDDLVERYRLFFEGEFLGIVASTSGQGHFESILA